MEIEKPEKQEIIRNPDGTFPKGVSGNPDGRPKGKTLKEWLKDKLREMTEEQRELFLKDIPKEMQWRMAEGNPAQDVTSAGEKINPIPIIQINALQADQRHEQDTGNEEKD